MWAGHRETNIDASITNCLWEQRALSNPRIEMWFLQTMYVIQPLPVSTLSNTILG